MALAAHFTRRELVTWVLGVRNSAVLERQHAAKQVKQVMQGVGVGCVALLKCCKASNSTLAVFC
jgi:hypothetical protein